MPPSSIAVAKAPQGAGWAMLMAVLCLSAASRAQVAEDRSEDDERDASTATVTEVGSNRPSKGGGESDRVAATTEPVKGATRSPRWSPESIRPPPLHIDYVSYGLAISADILLDAGATCRDVPGSPPCILGGGGGLVLRGGYRSPGPWYIGGAYQFSKTDSSNLYRLGILQQLRGEMRYMLDMGSRLSPYAMWGIGGVVYGNEWGVETGGGTLLAGIGGEWQISRQAVLGMAVVYQPILFAGWTDTAQFERDFGMAHFMRIELQLELRSELHRN